MSATMMSHPAGVRSSASVAAAEISYNPIEAGQGQQLEFRFGLLTHFLLSTGIFFILSA